MNLLQKAVQAIEECEAEVRRLAENALKTSNYSELKALAELAERLRRVHGGREDQETLHFSIADQEEADTGARASSAKRERRTYPLFCRDGDRLVKVGWSKKEKAEYEHRTAKDVLEKLYETVQAKFGAGRLFSVGALLPFEATDGDSVPDYQIYLGIKWLHGIGLLQKYGRDGYKLNGGSTAQDVAANWTALPEYPK